jgi:hypothetical protein
MNKEFCPEQPLNPTASKQLRLRFLASLKEIDDEIADRLTEMINEPTSYIIRSQDKYFPLTYKVARERAIEFIAQCVERGANETWIIR